MQEEVEFRSGLPILDQDLQWNEGATDFWTKFRLIVRVGFGLELSRAMGHISGKLSHKNYDTLDALDF
jgi:hypothetical protein